ncbi:MAG: histidine kinase [Arthrobacter sp.]|jgi:two-component system LytT family sensor kinase|nr:histidine kinase [Arthrobacter sp.]
MDSTWAVLAVAALGATALVLLATWGILALLRRDRTLGGESEHDRYATLHEVGLTAAALSGGVDASSAPEAAAALASLLRADGVALYDAHHRLTLWGRWPGGGAPDLPAGGARAKVRRVKDAEGAWHVVTAPLRTGSTQVGWLAAASFSADAAFVRSVEEVASWVSALHGAAELESSRSALAEAQVRALRAQISPHFIYNSLNAIASFIHTDPERARELVLEFADFTRYSFRRNSDFTTLSEELQAIEGYLQLERARFGDRLRVRLDVAPEVLSLPLPFLTLQPLVENAVRHGLEARPGGGTVTLSARDEGDTALLIVDDDGVGAEPERVREVLAGASPTDHVGLRNVDLRLRQVYGAAAGLVVDTGPGAGMQVAVRIPKFHPAATAARSAREAT